MLYSRMVLQFGYSMHREYGISTGGLGEDTTKDKGRITGEVERDGAFHSLKCSRETQGTMPEKEPVETPYISRAAKIEKPGG